MGFRTLEIGKAAELHIKEGQLEVTTEEGVVYIPVEDLCQLVVHGANIRLSTMDLSILSKNKVVLTTLDDKYLPTAITLPFEGNCKQAKIMRLQVNVHKDMYLNHWMEIINRKILNQLEALKILGLFDDSVNKDFYKRITRKNVDYREAVVAKKYFELYYDGINRREESPINSRLNYGYAIVRSAIARSLVCAGFHPAFGIHHSNQLNMFNLADDLIEPYRPMVDIIAIKNDGPDINLSRKERRNLSQVLHNACLVDGTKVSILISIDMMVESLKRILIEDSDEHLKLPIIIPEEKMEGIIE